MTSSLHALCLCFVWRGCFSFGGVFPSSYHDVTKVLIDGGADVTVSTTSSSPLKEAIDGNFIQNEMYLREAGAPEPID